VKTTEFTVKATATVDGTEKTDSVQAKYEALETMHDAAKHFGSEAAILDALNQLLKQKAYSEAYVPLKARLEGPNKAIEKIAADLIKKAGTFGITLSEKTARERAKVALGL
jgi:hypothetical protein